MRQQFSSLIVVSLSALTICLTTMADEPATAPVRQEPRRLNASAAGVGRQIADLSFTDLTGKTCKLAELTRSHRAVVVCFTSSTCPLSKRYLPTLVRLEQAFGSRGVAFLLVNPVATDAAGDLRALVATQGLRGSYVHDHDGRLVAAFDAHSTTECFVLDAARTVVYRGAVDDQYGFGYSRPNPSNEYLTAALDATLADRPIVIAATDAPGCAVTSAPATPGTSSFTYHNRISRIVLNHCCDCHRAGGVAPFTLTTYEDMIAHGAMIEQVLDRGIMPPWFATPPPLGQPSPWANDRSLAVSDKADLLAWLRSDRPAGNATDAPLPLQATGDWQIGKPDHIFQLPKPMAIAATGFMPFQDVMVDTNLGEDRWIQAIEVRPTARGVVHHIVVFNLGDMKQNPAGDPTADGQQNFFAIYVPGTSALTYPEGYAKRLPKGARLQFQLHYTPDGTATSDQTMLGVRFAKQLPQFEVQVASLLNTQINIPPHAARHEESASQAMVADVQILSFLPHLHLRGLACRYELSETDGPSRVILDVPRYDYNWQLLYRLVEPLEVKRGTKLKFTAWFDNSAANPANPDPTKAVRWGRHSFNEMLLGYVEYVEPTAKPGEATFVLGRGMGGGRLGLDAVFKLFDANGDGQLSRSEVRRLGKQIPQTKLDERGINKLFEQLDTDRNQSFSLEELKPVRQK